MSLCSSAVDAKPKGTTRLRRLANIADNLRISLLVNEWGEERSRLRWVPVDGRAEILQPREAEAGRGIELLRDKCPQYREMGLGGQPTEVIRITVERLVSWAAA